MLCAFYFLHLIFLTSNFTFQLWKVFLPLSVGVICYRWFLLESSVHWNYVGCSSSSLLKDTLLFNFVSGVGWSHWYFLGTAGLVSAGAVTSVLVWVCCGHVCTSKNVCMLGTALLHCATNVLTGHVWIATATKALCTPVLSKGWLKAYKDFYTLSFVLFSPFLVEDFPFWSLWAPQGVLKASSSFAQISKKVWHEGVFKWCNYIDTVVQKYCFQRNVWDQKLLLHMTEARLYIDTLWLLTLPPDGIMPSSVMIVNDNDLHCWSVHARGLS